MKQYVFRFSKLVEDMSVNGRSLDLRPFNFYKVIDGRNCFTDHETGAVVCYHLYDGQDLPTKFYVPTKWCEVKDL